MASSESKNLGTLQYDKRHFDLDDRTLAHVQALVSIKLRRHEPFLLSWSEHAPLNRHTLWVDRGVPLHMYFYGSRAATLNMNWLAQLVADSSRPNGASLDFEPPPPE